MRWLRFDGKMTRGLALVPLWLLLGLFAFGPSGCKPKYPNCEGDNDCPANTTGKEWCVNGQCQLCRPGSNDCGAGRACVSGRCQALPGFCNDNSQCPTGTCQNNICVSCKTDASCPGGGRCEAGKCIADTRKLCKNSDECAEDEDCVSGRCTKVGKGSRYTAAQSGPCNLETIYFGYNEFDLSSSNTSTVDKNAECLKKAAGRSVTLVGHTDPRGTPEYNLALSDKRTQAVRQRMRNLGVDESQMYPVPRGELDSSGTDEDSYTRDRRVEVNWR